MATNNNPLLNCPPLRFPDFSDPWQQTTLGEVAEITSGYSGEQEQIETPYRVSRIETISSGAIDINRVGFVPYDTRLEGYKLSLGDILFSNINSIEHIGKSAIVSKPMDLYHGMNLLRLKVINAEPYILYSHFQRDVVRNRFRSIANKAVSQASINQTALGKESVSLPSLAEQRKIAEFLSLIDERIETQRQTIEERKKQKKALLHQIFSQSLRFPDFSDPWQQTTLGEVCTIKTGKLDANAMVENGSYPFFTCAKQTYQTDTYSFSGEAILIAGNGEVGLTKYYNGKFNAYQRTYVLQSFSSDIILLFIRNHIDYALPKRIISFLNGSAMPYITLSTLTDMPISLPSLPEQRKIAELLAIFDERIEAEEALLKCYEAQKRHLLRQMFV